jgi:predicted MFS family arabinose efflux permease
MTSYRRSLLPVTLLVVGSVLSSTLLIPGVRPFVAWAAPGNEGAAHTFMALGLLGGVLGAPLFVKLSRRTQRLSVLASVLALADALLLLALVARPPLAVLLAVRTLQGALNLGLLSVILGAAPLRQGERGSSSGALGVAVMLGVALGAPLGTLCLRLGPAGPVAVGGLLELAVAAALPFVPLSAAEPARPDVESLPWAPMAWVFAERLAIGLFVVTFALHARACLGATDSEIGLRMTVFMAAFVLSVYPAAALADRLGATPVATLGLIVYGFAWLALPTVDLRGTALLMPVLGGTSACAYAAAMRCAVSSHRAGSRIAAMSGINSAGALGMLCGTAVAGILSAAHGSGAHAAHEQVLQLAGGSQVVAGLTTAAVISFARRQVRPMRS